MQMQLLKLKLQYILIEFGLGDENSETSIYDDLPTVEDGLMDVDSEVETTVFVVGLGVDNFETAICVGD